MICTSPTRRRLLLAAGASAFGGSLLGQMGRALASGNSEPIKLLLGSHMDYLQALAPAYAEAYGSEPSIELVTTPDLPVKLNSTMIARRSPGDAVFVTAALVAGLADKGWLSDLTDLVENELLPNGLIENSVTAATYQGRRYGVPVTIGCPIMHWNKNLCEAAGLDPEAPADWHAKSGSWDDLITYAKAITDPDNNVYGLTDNWGGVGNIFTFGAMLQGNGGRFLDEALDPVMNSEAGVEALSRMIELLHVHKVIDPAVVTYTWVFDASPAYLETAFSSLPGHSLLALPMEVRTRLSRDGPGMPPTQRWRHRHQLTDPNSLPFRRLLPILMAARSSSALQPRWTTRSCKVRPPLGHHLSRLRSTILTSSRTCLSPRSFGNRTSIR